MTHKGEHIRKNNHVNLMIPQYRVPKGKGKEVVWNSIFEKIEHKHQRKHVFGATAFLRIAAVLVGAILVAGFSGAMILGNVVHYSPKGIHTQVVLPDASRVTLNADTRVEYNKYLWYFSRKLTLTGEALFKVTKGKTFAVVTGDVTTTVLGTTFNVYARNNEVTVSCVEGSVEVNNAKSATKVVLKPSHSIAIKSAAVVERQLEPVNQMAVWVEGEFTFHNQSLSLVVSEIERQYNVTITLNISEERFYTGVFYNRNLDEALDLVCVPMNLKWTRQNNEIEIFEESAY